MARAFRKDAVFAILAIVALIDLLFAIDASARGHGVAWSDVPAKLVVYLVLSGVALGIYIVMQAISGLPLSARTGLLLAIGVICGTVHFPLVQAIFSAVSGRETLSWTLSFRGIQTATLPYLFVIAGLTALDYHRAVRERERQLARNQVMIEDAQRLALRYEINPHFLFNSLNSVSSLVLLRENSRAEEMLLRLSGFFRQTLETGGAKAVPLRVELDMQEAYVEIERVRFGEELQLDLEVPDLLLEALVPPLLLQPLVENAIKHGAAAIIRLRAVRRDRMLVIEIENDVRREASLAGTRTGLRNVVDRLQSYYGSAASLAIYRPRPSSYGARVSIPLEYELVSP